VGLALGTFSDRQTTIKCVRLGTKDKDKAPEVIVANWIKQRGVPTLLALDAPLGWPAPLSQALSRHRAGSVFDEEANFLFRRETDRFIREKIKKQSFDIGADKIARTAHAALTLLGELRRLTKEPISLAWSRDIGGANAIEVYPAATLKAHGIAYEPDNAEARLRLCDALQTRIGLPADTSLMQRSRDAMDAAICVLAGHDFLNGQALDPENPDLAEQEGWIWVRDPDTVSRA
jgi:hypothetical protein